MNTTNFAVFAAENLAAESMSEWLKGVGGSNVFACVAAVRSLLREEEKRQRLGQQTMDRANVADEDRRYDQTLGEVSNKQEEVDAMLTLDQLLRRELEAKAVDSLRDFITTPDAAMERMKEGDSNLSDSWLRGARELGGFSEEELQALAAEKMQAAVTQWEKDEPALKQAFAAAALSEKALGELDLEETVDRISAPQQYKLIVAGINAMKRKEQNELRRSARFNNMSALGTIAILRDDVKKMIAFLKHFEKSNLKELRAYLETGRDLPAVR